MKYAVYAFDFDLTLADASDGIVQCMNYAFGEMGFEPKGREEIRRTIGIPLEGAFVILTGVQEPVKGQFRQLYVQKADKVMTGLTELFPDTISVLRKIKESGAKVAIISSKYRYRIEEALCKFDISELVDYIVGTEDVKEYKPSPEGLFVAISHFGVQPKEVLYVGDTVIDAQAAQNAGTDFAGVTTGTTSYEEFLPYPHVSITPNLSGIILR